MDALIHLLVRIACGERLEKGCREDTAWWLGGLAIMPIMIYVFATASEWIEKSTGFGLDSYLGVFVLILLFAFFTIGILVACVRVFRRAPLVLIPIAILTWSGGAWIFWNKTGN